MLLAIEKALLESRSSTFFGAFGRWPEWARENCSSVNSCAYGDAPELPGLSVHNEDLTRMTFSQNPAAIIVHGDVLEHIPNVDAVFAETFRVLRPGGRTIFRAPFFQLRGQTTVRAVVENGAITNLLPSEIHGDPPSPEGILAFYNFGLSLLDLIRNAGFSGVTANMVYAPQFGIVSSDSPIPDSNMMPFYISAERPN